MARYIDADALIEVLQEWRDTSSLNDGAGNPVDSILYDAIRHIEDAPTADVAPRAEVAREIFEEIRDLIRFTMEPYSTTLYAKIEFEKLEALRKKYREAEPPKGE